MSEASATAPDASPGRRRLWSRWRGSLQAKVVTLTLLICSLATAGIGAFLTVEIRDGMFDNRLDQILDDAASSARYAQTVLDASTADTPSDTQLAIGDLVSLLHSSGSADRDVALLRSPGQAPVAVIDQASNTTLVDRTNPADSVISPGLRLAVQSGEGQYWQAVDLATQNADEGAHGEPGIAVGSAVTVKFAGDYELYLVYSLAAEQSTLTLTERILLVGGVAMIAVLGLITYVMTRQIVTPVRSAAATAERLAAGALSERMAVRGTDEMARLAASFNEMAASLQEQFDRMAELSASQRRFVSDVSHELRTPLTTIRMAGDLLHRSRSDFSPEAARSAELLNQQLDRFDSLLADLLEISRFDAGAAQLASGNQDLRDLASRVIDLASPLADQRGCQLRLYFDDEECTADFDVRRIERVVRNLVINAIEHSEGRPVDIHVAANETAVALVVRDHGVGMTSNEVDHVFDRFWRADPARARTIGGTGLGLAISREDVRLHGGSLHAWGDPGHGASFRLVLPRWTGADITHPPLDLVPANPDDAELRRPDRNPLDPASLPDLTAWEVSR